MVKIDIITEKCSGKTMNLQTVLKLSRNPGWILQVPEEEQLEAELIHDEWLGIAHDAVKVRHEEERRVRADIKAWTEKPEMAVFAKAARKRYLEAQLRMALRQFKTARERFIQAKRDGSPTGEIEREAEGISKKIRGYEISLEVLEGKRDPRDTITDDMIERAREYPIKNLLEIGYNGRAKCVFHQGEDFNMDIRKNFAYCYVCGESGDSIKVYRAKHGAEFREAIINLQ